MNYIRITTSDNIEIEYRLAGAGSRISAAVVDLLAQTAAFAAVCLLLYFAADGPRAGALGLLAAGGPPLAVLIVMSFLIYFVYHIFFEMLMNGQSPGKRLFRLRVVGGNGRPVGLFQSLIRNVFRYTADMPGIGVITMLCSRKGKRVGDMLASTVVISENGSLALESLTFEPYDRQNPPPAGGAGYGLPAPTADEVSLLAEYNARRASLPDGGEKIKRMLGEYFSARRG
ncbi:MAG: RDD family protein [Firmicutes bacterium]|nr:RDD family protein [Bacillota bacterium]